MLKKGTHIRWLAKSARGSQWREGVVRGHYPAGRRLRLPASADPNKLKAADVNRVHARYLVEIPRRHKTSGRRMSSLWMAPKAVALEKALARRGARVG